MPSQDNQGFDVPEVNAPPSPNPPTQAAPATVPTPKPPPVVSTGGGASKEADEPLADNLRDALAQLQQVEALPERTAKEERIKQVRLAKIRKRVHQLQQGLPQISTGADQLVPSLQNQAAILKRQRLELLAREHPEVRELLEAHQKLTEEIAKFRKKPK
jgi:uncharacterized phage infection (PIP) family protein YhgE